MVDVSVSVLVKVPLPGSVGDVDGAKVEDWLMGIVMVTVRVPEADSLVPAGVSVDDAGSGEELGVATASVEEVSDEPGVDVEFDQIRLDESRPEVEFCQSVQRWRRGDDDVKTPTSLSHGSP